MAHQHACVRLSSLSLLTPFSLTFKVSPLCISYRAPSLLSHPLLFLGMLTIPFNKPLRDTIATVFAKRKREFGFFAIQSTKPQTIGYLQADSPAGLLAWIYEKLILISHEYSWTDDEGALSTSTPPPHVLCSTLHVYVRCSA